MVSLLKSFGSHSKDEVTSQRLNRERILFGMIQDYEYYTKIQGQLGIGGQKEDVSIL